ncbi:MAG: type II toxin-antitoxin system MqsA family antitoxin [Gammaproteobacteria bacterium]|nr:type II toxin-antitoxin system MqsA family antitoxin [Gammaproteobacteria bacterium]
MKCTICKLGETNEGLTMVTLHREESVIVIKNVPAKVCNNCGEYYLSDDISGQVMALAEEAVNRNAKIEVLRFTA